MFRSELGAARHAKNHAAGSADPPAAPPLSLGQGRSRGAAPPPVAAGAEFRPHQAIAARDTTAAAAARSARKRSVDPGMATSSAGAIQASPLAPSARRPGSSHDPDKVRRDLGPGAAIPSQLAAQFSPGLGRDLSDVRVHTASPVPAAMGAQALTVGNHVAFAPGRFQPGSAAGQHLIAHELAHVVQQAGGAGTVQGAGLDYNGYEAEADRAAAAVVAGGHADGLTPVRAGVIQRGPDQPAAPIASSAQPLAGYYMLFGILSPAEMGGLETAAARREALRAGTSYSGDAGITEIGGTLERFLPPSASFVKRDEILATYYDRLASELGASAAAGALATLIGRNEALRVYLSDKLDLPTTIKLKDPDGKTNTPTSLDYVVDGVDIATTDGDIAVGALDALASKPLQQVADAADADARQLVEIAVIDKKGQFALAQIDALIEQVDKKAATVAPTQLSSLIGAIDIFMVRATALNGAIRAANSDKSGGVATAVKQLPGARTRLTQKLAGLKKWLAPSMPPVSAGEYIEDAMTADEQLMDANLKAGGWNTAYLPVNVLDWAAGGVLNIGWNVLTLGTGSLKAKSDRAYRKGDLSNEAWRDNEWVILGAGLVTAVITVLTDGLGSGAAGNAAVRLFGMELGANTLATQAIKSGGAGALIGVTTAVGSDVYNSIVADASSVPGTKAFASSNVVGPAGWAAQGLGGFAIGTGTTWGMGKLKGNSMFVVKPGEPAWNELVPLQEKPGQTTITLNGMKIVVDAGAVSPAEPFGFPKLGGDFVGIDAFPVRPTGPAMEVSSGKIRVRFDKPPQPLTLPDLAALEGKGGAAAPDPIVLMEKPSSSATTPSQAPAMEPVLINPNNKMILRGSPRADKMPGNIWKTQKSTGIQQLTWQWYEQQIASTRATSPGEVQPQFQLISPRRFTGRTQAQGSVIPDLAKLDLSAVTEAKMRNWEYVANVNDAIGTIQRAVVLLEQEAATKPAARSASIELVSSREWPQDVHQRVLREAAVWMRSEGFDAVKITDYIHRIIFTRERFEFPK